LESLRGQRYPVHPQRLGKHPDQYKRVHRDPGRLDPGDPLGDLAVDHPGGRNARRLFVGRLQVDARSAHRQRDQTRSAAVTEHVKPRVGELRRRTSLGSEAVYRVCRVQGELVEVEVVRAPGLSSGQHFTFTLGAVSAMEVVIDPPGETPAAGG